MASNSPAKPLSITDTPAAVSDTPEVVADTPMPAPTPAKSFDISLDSTMARPRLSVDQLRHCAEALQRFKTKTREMIRKEFQILQVLI